MKKYLLHGATALLTFIVGIGVVALVFWLEPVAEDTVSNDPDQVQQATADQYLSFEPWGVIADGTDSSGLPATFTSLKASDGAIIQLTTIWQFRNETSVLKRFKYELGHASRVVERTPNFDYWKRKIGERALIESSGKISIITYSGGLHDYHLSIVETPSLKHALDFEKREKSFEASLIVNQLKP